MKSSTARFPTLLCISLIANLVFAPLYFCVGALLCQTYFVLLLLLYFLFIPISLIAVLTLGEFAQEPVQPLSIILLITPRE